jgi:hypothetical protein
MVERKTLDVMSVYTLEVSGYFELFEVDASFKIFQKALIFTSQERDQFRVIRR